MKLWPRIALMLIPPTMFAVGLYCTYKFGGISEYLHIHKQAKVMASNLENCRCRQETKDKSLTLDVIVAVDTYFQDMLDSMKRHDNYLTKTTHEKTGLFVSTREMSIFVGNASPDQYICEIVNDQIQKANKYFQTPEFERNVGKKIDLHVLDIVAWNHNKYSYKLPDDIYIGNKIIAALEQQFRHADCDLVIGITGLRFCLVDDQDSVATKPCLGLARPKGKFSVIGINCFTNALPQTVFAHEIAHNLSANHDSIPGDLLNPIVAGENWGEPNLARIQHYIDSAYIHRAK
jgi:hypothetical protein